MSYYGKIEKITKIGKMRKMGKMGKLEKWEKWEYEKNSIHCGIAQYGHGVNTFFDQPLTDHQKCHRSPTLFPLLFLGFALLVSKDFGKKNPNGFW